jgi:hypothetical protein
MTTRTLVAILTIGVLSCGIASGETVTKTYKRNVSVSSSPQVRMSVTASADSGSRPSHRGWLGIRISPVPAPLAAHLQSKNMGAMVADLVKGSPAHKAGVKQYDVIVGLDNGPVKDGQGLIKSLTGRKAGEKIKIWIMRQGKKIQIPIVLGKPLPIDKVQFLHQKDFLNVQRDITRLHPHVILRKGDGDWKKMGGKDLPEEIRKMLKSIPRNVEPGVNSNVSVSAKTVIRTKDSKGTDVRLEQDETGKIIVSRTRRDDNGNEEVETKVYMNREQLRLSDPDAFELLKKTNIKVSTSPRGGKVEKQPRRLMPEIKVFTSTDGAKINKEIHDKILKSIENMDLPDDIKKQIRKQLQSQMQIREDKPETKTPKKKRKTKAKKTPKKPRKPKVENTSATHT